MTLPYPNISAAAAARTPVDVGSAANDGTGDPLRTAFILSNARDAGLEAAIDQAAANFSAVDTRLTSLEGSAMFWNMRGDWATATAYVYTPGVRRDVFRDAATGDMYVTLVSHTSTSLAADQAAGKIANSDTAGLSADVADLRTDLTAAEAALATLTTNVGAMPTMLAGYTALRAYTGGASAVTLTSSGVTGLFVHDIADTTSTDNGATVIVGSDSRRWKRVFTGAVNVTWFGAVGDGTTDDASAFNAALALGRPILVPYTADGYRIGATLVVPSGASLVGHERKSKLKVDSGVKAFELRGGNVVLEKLLVDQSAGSGGFTFHLATSLGSIDRVFLRDIEVTGSTKLLYDDNHASNVIVYLKLENVIASLQRGPGVVLTDAFAYIKFSHVTVDYVGSASRNHIAYSFANTEGLQLEFVDVTGGLVDATTTGNHGFAFQNCISVWLDACMADTVGGVGFYLVGDCQEFSFSKCVSSLCGSYGFAFYSAVATSYGIRLDGCMAIGRRGQSYAPATIHGYLFSGYRITLTGCHARDNTGSGVAQLTTGANNVVSGGAYSGNTRYAIEAEGTGSLLATGFLSIANTAGNVSLAGSLQHAAAWQSGTGALVTATTGPAGV